MNGPSIPVQTGNGRPIGWWFVSPTSFYSYFWARDMSGCRIATIILTLSIAGCGGSGNGGAGTPPGGGDAGGGNPPQTPDLQTSVPAPTYPADSEAFWYFETINQQRQQLGLGLLAQNAQLDAATKNHAAYLYAAFTQEEIASGLETPGKKGFTGVTAQDRCNYVGYPGTCAQNDMWSEIYFTSRPSPYQGLLALRQGARQIGITMYHTSLFGGMSNGPEIQLGHPAGSTPQRQGPDFLLVAQLWGAIHVHINEGETLTVETFKVLGPSGQEMAGEVLTSANDPRQRVPANAAMFVPTPGWFDCEAGGTYVVNFSGKRGNVPFSLTRGLTLGPYPFCG